MDITGIIDNLDMVYDHIPPSVAEASEQMYISERTMMKYISSGDLEGLLIYVKKTPIQLIFRAEIDNDAMNFALFSIGISLMVRAAIEGGLDCSLGFYMSNGYISQLSRAKSKKERIGIAANAAIAYTTRVAQIKKEIDGDYIVNRVSTYVQRYVNRPITVSAVADYLGLNLSYLSHYFTTHKGMSVKNYIHTLKCQEAKTLLTSTTMSLVEISNYLAYSSQSHFQNTFKKLVGVTPSEFRKKPF